MRPRRWPVFLAILSAVHVFSCAAYAIDPANVLLLYNPASADGIAIKDHYLLVHPGVQTLAVTGLGTSEDITADEYLRVDTQNPGIRQQVLAKFNALLNPPPPPPGENPVAPITIDQIITTKGMPLRIQVTQSQPTSSQYPGILNWKPYSSLESELAAIDTISTWQMMGDQSWQWPGHFTRNPYYNSTQEFSHGDQVGQFGTRLTARLDGYTVADVNNAVDNAQQVFVGPPNSPAGPVHFLVDNDPARPWDQKMTQLVNEVLGPAGMPLTYDDTSAFIGPAPGPLIGFDSHGVHQASTAEIVAQQGMSYIDYLTDVLGQTLADGAVFTSIESFNAYSFNVGGYTGNQGQVAQWLAAGGTAGVGYVEEPIASWVTASNENILFRSLLDGMTFGEAAWAANYQVSYVNTVIGDPLMTWKQLVYGDINRDGFVDISDLAIMGAHWSDSVASGGFGWTIGDLNSDGSVDISDLAILGAHWGQISPWATAQPAMAQASVTDLSKAIEAVFHPTPEPASWVLMALGLAAFLANRTRARRRLAGR